MDDKYFKCRSIYFASYLMYKYNVEIAGTKIEGKKVVFLFNLDKQQIDTAIAEFKGESDQDAENGVVVICDYLVQVNKLKDISRNLTTRYSDGY